MSDYHTNALNEVLGRLGESPFLAAAVRHLKANGAAINAQLKDTVLSEIPAFSQSGNPDVLPELARHANQHTDEILRLLGGGALGDFEYVREHARRRAEQRFPLEATLHAYRCGHKIFSRWMREAALSAVTTAEDAQSVIAAVADFTIEYTDAISTIAAGAYLLQTRLLADVAGDQRAELLNVLLEGCDESDGRVAEVLRDAGFADRRLSYCVALAQPVDPAEMHNPARARRLVDSIDTAVREAASRRVIDLRDGKVVIVFAGTIRASGWTTPRRTLCERVTAVMSTIGNAVLAGVSTDVSSTSRIPIARDEAKLALEFASVAHRVVRLSEIPVQQLTLHLAGEGLRRVLPAWSLELRRCDEKSGGALVRTLRAYADADMNALKAAQALSVHPNTLYARFQKVADITGLQPRSYHALTELLIVAGCARERGLGASMEIPRP